MQNGVDNTVHALRLPALKSNTLQDKWGLRHTERARLSNSCAATGSWGTSGFTDTMVMVLCITRIQIVRLCLPMDSTRCSCYMLGRLFEKGEQGLRHTEKACDTLKGPGHPEGPRHTIKPGTYRKGPAEQFVCSDGIIGTSG